MNPLRIGVVGLSWIGQIHHRVLSALDGFQVTAVCDKDSSLLQKHAGEGKSFEHPSELIQSGSVEAVVLALPPSQLPPLIEEALRKKLHVYTEKPFVPTLEQGRAIESQARESGCCVQVGLQFRFHHGYAAAKRLISENKIGALVHGSLVGTNWFRSDAYFRERPWRGTWDAGGGVLMVQGIHPLDVFLWITGKPSRVTARVTRSRPEIQIEDEAQALFEYENGMSAQIRLSTKDAVGIDRLEFHGDRGSIIVEDRKLRWTRLPGSLHQIKKEETRPMPPLPLTWEEIAADGAPTEYEDCIRASHRDFRSAIQEGRAPLNSLSESNHTLEVIHAVYTSALEERTVGLPLEASCYTTLFSELRSGKRTLPICTIGT